MFPSLNFELSRKSFQNCLINFIFFPFLSLQTAISQLWEVHASSSISWFNSKVKMRKMLQLDHDRDDHRTFDSLSRFWRVPVLLLSVRNDESWHLQSSLDKTSSKPNADVFRPQCERRYWCDCCKFEKTVLRTFHVIVSFPTDQIWPSQHADTQTNHSRASVKRWLHPKPQPAMSAQR